MEGWASEVVTEDDDFILGETVGFGAEMRLERACLPLHQHGVPPCSRPIHLLGVRGAPALMTHLGKVVLFFSQGLRTGSGGQATNQKEKGQGMPTAPHPVLPPTASSAPVQTTISGDCNPQCCLHRLAQECAVGVRTEHPGICSSCG